MRFPQQATVYFFVLSLLLAWQCCQASDGKVGVTGMQQQARVHAAAGSYGEEDNVEATFTGELAPLSFEQGLRFNISQGCSLAALPNLTSCRW